MSEISRKSMLSSILIGFGVYILLIAPYPLGAFIFAFGLLSICTLKLNLFTGMCGYVIENKNPLELLYVLIVNCWLAISFGLFATISNPTLQQLALDKVNTWDFSIAYLIKSIFCGIIMFIAVDTYKKGTKLGILLGIPLFIICGFQHSIANCVLMGMCVTFKPEIFLCIIGNFIGGILGWGLTDK